MIDRAAAANAVLAYSRTSAREPRHSDCFDPWCTHSTRSTKMGSKNQGEGDYESARHYNDETRKFVEGHAKDLKGDASKATDKLSPEEQTALSHAKSGAQDKRDAKVLSDMEKQHHR